MFYNIVKLVSSPYFPKFFRILQLSISLEPKITKKENSINIEMEGKLRKKIIYWIGS
jgi:hypothetical protein